MSLQDYVGWRRVGLNDATEPQGEDSGVEAELTTISVDGEGITNVVVRSNSSAWLLDDLEAS